MDLEDAIDRKHFEDATFGDRTLQRDVLELFDAQAEKMIAVIRASTGRARGEAAHSLKGAARGIGAFAVADAAEAVERGMDLFDARLESRVTDARKAVKMLLAELAGAA